MDKKSSDRSKSRDDHHLYVSVRDRHSYSHKLGPNTVYTGRVIKKNRSAYIQMVSLMKRYIIYKKRHWFSLIVFDILMPLVILLVIITATVASHFTWMSKCQNQSLNVDQPVNATNTMANNSTIIRAALTKTFATPSERNTNNAAHTSDIHSSLLVGSNTPEVAHETYIEQPFVSDSSNDNSSDGRQHYKLVIIPDDFHLPQIHQHQHPHHHHHHHHQHQSQTQSQLNGPNKRELIINFDLYNILALGLVIWIMYLFHVLRTVNFLVEDKITGRRFLMHIHGLKKFAYFVAHYIMFIMFPLIISMVLVVGLSTLVSPDYLVIHLLTFVCFSIQLTSLIFALSTLCQSQSSASLVSLLVWTGHLLLIMFDERHLIIDNERTLSYAIQFFTCILPEQVIIYIYRNERKLSTGWDSVPKLKLCKHRGVFPMQSNILGIGGGVNSSQTTLVNAMASRVDSKSSLPDEYLLSSMIAWSILLILFAYTFDDLSISRPSEGYRRAHDCCTFRDNLKTLLWDPLRPTLIRDSFASLSSSGAANRDGATGLIPKYFENVELNQGRYLGIYIDHVTKQMNTSSNLFGLANERTIVVDGVSFNIYRGQVTLLLGHNGAGKTTIMNMIVGRVRPTSGRVYVNGLDVVAHNEEVRCNMSLCPQDSIITDYLTVFEHLELMASIKQGVAINNDINSNTFNQDHMRQHVASIASEIGLRDQLGKCAYQLSGGAKRKLSLAMSFVGDSSILVLDEPSSGLDPESRKMIWDAIKRRKSSRTLLISTQHMEEADYLGDRVAIMNRGKITCCGSAVFLKRVLGSGNKLRLALLPRADRNHALMLVREFFPEAIDRSRETNKLWMDKMKKEKLNDVLIELKTSQKTEVEDEDGLIRLFEKLEASHEQYGIKSFSLHGSTVEDVLLNSAKISNNLANPDFMTLDGGLLSEDVINMKLFSLLRASGRDINQTDPTLTKSEGTHLGYIRAMMGKNFMVIVRNWYSVLLLRIIIPILVFYYIFYSLRLIGQGHIAMRSANGNNELKLTRGDEAPTPAYIYFESYGVVTRVFSFFAFVHFIVIPTEERVSKFKLILLNSRANVLHYWLSQYLVDLVFVIFYLLAIFIYLNVSSTINISAMLSSTATATATTVVDASSKMAPPSPAVVSYGFNTIVRYGIFAKLYAVLTTFLFCSSLLVVCYLLSLLCTGPLSASMSLLALFSLGYLTDVIVSFSGLNDMIMQDQTRSEEVANILHYMIPSETYHVSLALLLDSCLKNDLRPVCPDNRSESRCEQKLYYLLSSDNILVPLIVQLVQFVLLVVLLMSAECYDLMPTIIHLYDSVFYSMASKTHNVKFSDDDIEREKFLAHGLSNLLEKRDDSAQVLIGPDRATLENIGLVVYEAVKVYSNGTRAVDDISFTVSRNEIFGLLGVTGAGKTSTFGLLSGDVKPDSGHLWANNFNVVREAAHCRKYMGYDPQVDPSFDLTILEALYLMARLRGIASRNQTTAAIQSCLDLLDLHQHSDTPYHKLSTGTRRKLSLALAWMGSPPLLLLDEPTSGVDPITRRNIWSSLTQMKIRARQSIVIASNTMEECEAICDRLAIISRGQIRCLGTVQNLSARYNQGYLLRLQFDSVKAAPRNRMTAKQLIEDVNSYLKGHIPSLVVDDTSVDSAMYKITDSRMPRSSVLKILRQTRADFNGCISYMLSDATLDDVFLALAREQERGDKSIQKSKSKRKESHTSKYASRVTPKSSIKNKLSRI